MTEGTLREESIFLEALEIKGIAERVAFLDHACGQDSRLRAGVEALLRANMKSGDLLDIPERTDTPTLGPTFIPSGLESPGTQIGPYKLLEEIGDGGMGVVYLAEQKEPVRRKVALKVIKPGMDSREVIARFEVERQALAMMDHPNISRMLDAGTTAAGRPYFVMDLVKGVPITKFCDQQKLDTRQRLELFITVCQAVQHAHQKGLIHRDLKPSNVLVQVHDVMPVPKVIDFGTAKAIGQQLTDKTLNTGFSQMVGTPLYMSPEQAGGSSIEIDTRSDVYSLGVLLYELLTGDTAFARETLRSVGFDEMRRMIREVDPPRPSARVSTLQAKALSTVSECRQVEPRKLSQQLRGELDWIVMKSLEKDRTLRYGSADALAADLQCYLDDRPVHACPPSAAYRLSKFVQRKRWLLSALTVFAICIPLAAYGAYILIRDAAPQPLAQQHSSVVDGLPPRATHPGKYIPGLIPEPAVIPALGRWQITSATSRGFMKGVAWSPDGQKFAFGEAGNIRICDAANLRLMQILVGHTRPVSSIAWSPDGKVIASSSWDGTVRLWGSDGVPLYRLEGHTGRVHAVTWSPDGLQLASAGLDRTIRLWGADGTAGRVITGHTQSVNCVAWSPDGQWIASAAGEIYAPEGEDNTVRVWKSDGTPVRVLEGQPSPVHWVAWSPDSQRLASTHGERRIFPGRVLIWNLDGTAGPVLAGGGQFGLLCWSPDGRQLAATGGWSGTIRRWNTDGQEIGKMVMPNFDGNTDSGFTALAWSPNGQRLVAVSSRSIGMWDADGNPGVMLKSPSGIFVGVDWHPDGMRISSGGSQLWSWATDGNSASLISPHYAHYLDWSPDGQQLAWTDITDRTVCLTDADGTAGPLLNTGTAPTVAWHPDGKQIVSGGTDKLLRVWNADGTPGSILSGHTDSIRYVAWSPNGERIASGSLGEDGNLRLWQRDGTPGPVLFGHKIGVHGVAWSPDSKWVASAGADGTLRLWNSEGTPGPVIPHHADVYSVTWSLDGKWLATGTMDGLLRLWDASRLWEPDVEPTHVVDAHQGFVHCASWSPDSTRVVTASFYDSTIRVWNVETQRTEWTGLLLSDGTASTFDASGAILYGDPSVLSRDLLYLREQQSGAIEILTESEFQKRHGELILQHTMDRCTALATAAAEAGKLDEAAAIFDRVNDQNSSRDIAWDAELGDAFLEHQMYARAVVVFSSVIRRNHSWHLIKRRGAAYMGLREYEKALADITTAVEMSPVDATNFTWFPQSLLWESPPEIQAAFFDLATKAIELSPENYKVRASYFIHQGEYEKAIGDFNHALELNPLHSKYCNNLAWLLATCPDAEFWDPRRAVELAEKAIANGSQQDLKFAWNTLAVARYRNGDWAGALEALQKSMELNNGGTSFDWFFLAMAHWQLGQGDEAVQWHDKAVEWMEKNKPDDAELQRFRAEAASLLGVRERSTDGRTEVAQPVVGTDAGPLTAPVPENGRD